MSAGIPEIIPSTTLSGALSIPLVATRELDQPVLKRARRGWWRDIFEMVVLVVVIYTMVNLMTARAIVEGPSMQPNFYTGQLIIVNLFTYYFTTPQRGDVIVLHNPSVSCKDVIAQNAGTAVLLPNNSVNSGCDDLIKRVIGLPNETIQIKTGRVSINGVQLDEPYIAHFCESGCDGTWRTGPQQYFILGDNRNNSLDSHAFGPINRGLIVGRAWIRYWPLPDLGFIPRPTYATIPTEALPEATAAATEAATATN
jgi:signal peptidase I